MPNSSLSAAELRARYDALGKIEELPGERTFLIRCRSFDEFAANGATVSSDFSRVLAKFGPDELAEYRDIHPGLFDLIREAWPAT